MHKGVVRFTWLSALAVVLCLPPAQRLTELLPASFVPSLTPAASKHLANVRAVHVHLLQHPIAFYIRQLETVFYGELANGRELRHEAMHVVDPCHMDPKCGEAWAAQLPDEDRERAEVLYGPVRWSAIEYWPVVPAWYQWDVEQMPKAVRDAYAGVLR